MKKFIAFLASIGVFLTGFLKAEQPHNKQTVIILMGPPGAGKGTNADELCKQFQLAHISTGDIFRENLKNNTPLGQKAKSYMDKGDLAPDELVIEMVLDRVKKDDCKKGYILDGFPRTITQAEALDKYLSKQKIKPLVLNLDVDDGLLVERIVNRLVCKSCGMCFNKIFFPPKKEGICDNCGGELYQRKDDTKPVITERLHVYHSETEPLLSYYENKKVKVLFNINGDGEQEKIYDNLVKIINSTKR